jgi:hypothetical protein
MTRTLAYAELYEDNAGGLYIYAVTDDGVERAYDGAEHGGNQWVVDVRDMAADPEPDAWDLDYHLPEGYQIDLDQLDLIATFRDGHIVVERHPGYSGTRYLFGVMTWQGYALSDWSLNGLTVLANHPPQVAIRG